MNNNSTLYFGNFGVKHIPKEIKKFIGNKNIITNIYRIQAYNSIMCGYFCIGFIDLMIKDKSLLGYTNFFSPNSYEKKDKIFLIIKKVKKLYCVICYEYRKSEKPEISYLLEKTLVPSIICSKMYVRNYLKKKNQLTYQRFLVYLKIWNYFINMVEENVSQEFILKNIDETRNYLIEEINRNELMSKKHKKVCTTLNYIEHFLILGSTITGCVSISAFVSLVGIPIGIASSTIGLKICVITADIKKSTNKENKKKHEIILLAKSKVNSIEVLISKTLIDSNISHDETRNQNF